MVKTLEPLVENFSTLDLSTKEGIQRYKTEQKDIYAEECNECFSFDGCYSPSSCVDCYSTD